jgi:hypothetical protein
MTDPITFLAIALVFLGYCIGTAIRDIATYTLERIAVLAEKWIEMECRKL